MVDKAKTIEIDGEMVEVRNLTRTQVRGTIEELFEDVFGCCWESELALIPQKIKETFGVETTIDKVDRSDFHTSLQDAKRNQINQVCEFLGITS